MTPLEYAIHKAAAEVDPFGDDRQDIRAALNTLRVMTSMTTATESQLNDAFFSLIGYTQANKHDLDERFDDFSSVQSLFEAIPQCPSSAT